MHRGLIAKLNKVNRNKVARAKVLKKEAIETNRKNLLKTLNKLDLSQHYLLEINRTIWTITPENIGRLRRDLLVNSLDELTEEQEHYGSDVEIYQAFSGTYYKWKITKLNTSRNQRPHGAFFPYYVPFNGLEKFGVFSEENMENYKKPCIYQAFELFGVPEQKLQLIKPYFINGYLRRLDMKKVAKKLGYYITIKTIKNSDNKNHNYNNVSSYNKKPDLVHIPLGLIDNHYFLIKKTKFTSFSLKNYEKLKHKERWYSFYKKDERDNKRERRIDSFNALKIITKNNYKIKIKRSSEILNTIHHKLVTEIGPLEYDNDIAYEDEDGNVLIHPICKPIEIPETIDKPTRDVLFFDFEANSSIKSGHIPYLCSLYDPVTEESKSFIGKDCGIHLLNYIIKNYHTSSAEHELLLIAHNLRYDFGFLFQINNLHVRDNPIKTGNCMKRIQITYKKKKISLQDSYAYVSSPLKDFSKMFNLKVEKEVISHKFYNKKNIKRRYIPYNAVIKHYKKENLDVEKFNENINKWDCLRNNKVDIIKYSQKYCEMDPIVLAKGLKIFRQWMLEYFDIDIYDNVSIPQIARKYLINNRCFENVYSISGHVRDFIARCIVGGKVMTANNKKWHIKEPLADFDGVSLYPSAMHRIQGFPTGKPKVIKDFNAIRHLPYYVEIKITNVKKKRTFPCLTQVDDNKVRTFSNDIRGSVFIGHIALEDAIKYQDIEFEFIRGYYFEGYNNRVKEVILDMFNRRLKFKKEGNPVEVIFKLLMNAAYGKLIMKPIAKSIQFTYNEEEFNKKTTYNFNFINKIEKIKETDISMFEILKPPGDHYNESHCGIDILDMSKRIMNEVMYLAEDLDIPIYYQDTDSMHIKNDSIEKLANEYKNRFGRELIGKNLGQFHGDFKSDKLKGDIYAKESIFLGKKSYMDVLTDGKNIDYHIRMKGVPAKSVLDVDKNPLNTYKKLYNGEVIEFDILKGSLGFISAGYGPVKTKTEFFRKLSFP